MTIKKISCLVSAGLHPVSGQPRHCKNDSLALNIGLALAQTTAAEMQVLHAGAADNPALLDYLALGASTIEVLTDTAPNQVLAQLRAKLGGSDLILTGTRSESGPATGMLPYCLAEKLHLPLVHNALSVTVLEQAIEVVQFLPKGKRRRVRVALPAVVSIHPMAAVELRYAYARQLGGKIIVSAEAPSLENPSLVNIVEPAPVAWSTQPARRKPIKLKAHENKTGHARMLSAIVSESKQGTVVNEGTCVEKAQVVLNYLREHKLINF